MSAVGTRIGVVLLALAAGPAATVASPPPPPAIAASPLTLGEAIRLALERNRAVKVEAYAPTIARANLLAAKGVFDPAITFQRSRTDDGMPAATDPIVTQDFRTDSYSLALAGLTPWGATYSIGGNAQHQRSSRNDFEGPYASFGGITVTEPLLRGFGLAANLVGVRVARANRAISEWQYRQVLIDTVTQVVLTYSQLVLANDQLRIARNSREAYLTLVRDSQVELKVGSGTQSDVVTARAQVARTQDQIVEAEENVRTVENQLRNLAGETRFPTAGPAIVIVPPAIPAVAIRPGDDAETALANRPDYAAARLGIEINRANYALARNSLLPEVNFVGGYGYNGLDPSFAASRRMVADRENRSTSAGLVFSIPLTFAQARGTARAAGLRVEQSEEDLKRFQADIAMSVANAGSQIDAARRRVAADRDAYTLANRALQNEKKKLLAGRSSTLAVVQQQEFLIGVENSLAVGLYAERAAIANYDRELGTTLTRYGVAYAAR